MSDTRFSRETAFNASRYSKEKEFWLGQLAGDLVKSSFPYDFNKADRQPDDVQVQEIKESRPLAGRQEFNISGPLFEKLMWTINNSDLRLFMVLLANLTICLMKHTDREDIIVGAPIEKQETEGNFLNTILALRTQSPPRSTFKEVLLQVRQTLLEAGKNQNFPLERMPYELNLEVSANDTFALFDTAIMLDNIHEKKYISHISLGMLFSFSRMAERIEAVIEYDPAFYKEKTAARISHHFVHLLGKALENMDTRVEDLDIMPPEEKDFLLRQINDTACEFPQTPVHRLFEQQVEKNPGHIAVEEIDTGLTYTYKELDRRAACLAALLQARGVRQGSIVAVMGERTAGMITTILAILKVGAVFLPLDAQNPDERLTFILRDSAAAFFISQQKIIEERADLFETFPGSAVLPMDDESIYEKEVTLMPGTVPLDAPAYIIYTSGTTGKPKGVMIKHLSLTDYIHFADSNYTRGEALNFPFYTSIAFDLTITSIFTPLVSGNAVIVYSGWAKGNLIERIIDDGRAGVVKLTPSHLQLIADKVPDPSAVTVKRFVVGGEILKYPIARTIHDNFNGAIEIFNEYGPTEATVGCMIYKFDPIKDFNKGNSVSIGIPAANTQIYILNKSRNPVPIGAVGEMYIGGQGLAAGYINRPQLTADRFVIRHLSLGIGDERKKENRQYLKNNSLIKPHQVGLNKSFGQTFSKVWPPAGPPEAKVYRTGDLARWLDDGNIEFLGRVDQQVKLRGFRIELGEIENKLLQHEGVKEAVVTIKAAAGTKLYGYNTGDEHICAYIVAAKKVNAAVLREYLSGILPDYMIPSYFVHLDSIPLTTNGKVDMRALPSPALKAEVEYVAPRNDIEKKLVEIWSEILGLEENEISIEANFFDSGGHSLSGTVLAAKILKNLDIKVTLPDLFRLPRLRDLAQFLETAGKNRYTPIPAAEKRDFYPLSPAQARFFIIHQVNPDSLGYNIPMSYDIEGALDSDKLLRVFRDLIDRHAAFRTSFKMIDEQPVQEIHDAVNFEIQHFSLSSPSYPLSQDGKTREIKKTFFRPFDLSSAPLLRAALIRPEKIADQSVLLIDLHHIITDGVSMDILMKEFSALYTGNPLPAPGLHYKDFAVWQVSEESRAEMKKQEDYWLKQFKEEILPLDLPTDFPRPPIQSFAGAGITFKLEDKETSALRELASARGATLFMVFLAIYNILLAKLGNREDIIVGTPSAGRRHPDLENVIGLFINTLALRNYPLAQGSFLEFLNDVKINTLAAFENQEYQFEDLVAQVSKGRDARRNPITDVMFTFNNVDTRYLEIPTVQIPGLRMTPGKNDFVSSKVDLMLNAYDFSGKLSFTIEYATSIFKEATIQRFIRYFRQVVRSIIDNPLQKISQVDILSREEKEQLLYNYNNIEAGSTITATGPGSWDDHAFGKYREEPFNGAPLPGMIALILDPPGNLVSPGTAGRLYISVPATTAGHVDRTPGDFLSFPRYFDASLLFFKTSQLARWTPGGEIECLGSADAMQTHTGRQTGQPLIAGDANGNLPQDEIEEKLIETWADVLRIKKELIGTDVNFFQLGGSSLNAIVLVPRIHKIFDVKIPLTEFFKNPTVKAMADYIRQTESTHFVAIEAVEKKEYYPASLNQTRFYILQQMFPENLSYNIFQVYTIEGKLDTERLERAFNALVRRHDGFRTTLSMIDGQLVQEVHDEAPLNIEFYKDSNAAAPGIIKKFIRPFALDKAPLLRVGLIPDPESSGSDRHLLMVDMHHIITDGLSFVILTREFIACYENNELPPLRLQYSDFAEWQSKRSGQLQEQGHYWLEKFKDGIPLLKLRTDFPRPPEQDFSGNRFDFRIDASQTAKVEDIVRQEESSLFMVLYAVYHIMLWRMTEQEDIIVGTGVLNRGHVDLMNIIGLFFNTIPLRIPIEPQLSFTGYLQKVKDNMLEAFENQEYPVDMLVEDLVENGTLKRNRARNPLFDTMFALQNFKEVEGSADKSRLSGLSVKPYQLEMKISRVDLFFIAMELADSIFMSVEYATTLFKPSTAEKIAGYYMDVLEQVLANKNIKLEEITLSGYSRKVEMGAAPDEFMDFVF